MSIRGENVEARSAGLPHEGEDEVRKRYEQRQKENAFRYLTESGRAENREEAEQYLVKVTTIKEKLIGFLHERLQTQTERSPYSGHDPYNPEVLYGTWDNLEERNKSATENITVRNINRTNPQLWKLKRVFEPSYVDQLPGAGRSPGAHFEYLDTLQVAFNEGEKAEVVPDLMQNGKIAISELGKYLTEDELEFIKQDYAFALQDLQRELRAAADRVVDTAGWQVLARQQ